MDYRYGSHTVFNRDSAPNSGILKCDTKHDFLPSLIGVVILELNSANNERLSKNIPNCMILKWILFDIF
ncbi:hypothetical protein FCV53_22205 [Vibrio sp. F12]|uniref:hypothetical protein n=1 Tax=Vibrio sp. F12 TaxID=2070776 RepID=UPI0010BD8459|nr:hypothetical protein [Vibrio sp. F12]TKE88707.1 hypothetical protein FCV53_22205 [Vibrio sp. F12]